MTLVRTDIEESYYRITIRNHITELYYWIILQNHIQLYTCEKTARHPRKRMPGIPGESPGPPGMLGDPPRTPLDSPDPPGTVRGAPTDHENDHISTKLQRKKLSIAASKSLRCNASPQRLPWAFLSYILQEQSRHGGASSSQKGSGLPIGPPGQAPLYI